MPNENEIFSGLPGLDDEAGLEQFMSNQAAQEMAGGTGGQVFPRTMVEGQDLPKEDAGTQTQTQTQPQATYTAEQVKAIIDNLTAQNAEMQRQAAMAAQQRQAQMQQQVRRGYTPQEQAAISQLLARGYTLDQITAAISKRSAANQANAQLMQRLAAVEDHLRQQEYLSEQNSFIEKMSSFGDKFGLSEQDLVTFGNYAMSKGINLTQVNDVEAVFRALYPQQYAIRMQRMSNAPTSQIYGGSSAIETPQQVQSQAADAYVEQFLRRAMPNDYLRQTKK